MMKTACLFTVTVLLTSVCAQSSKICATAKEGDSATLSCPSGLVVDHVLSAVFGEFEPSSSCKTGLEPTTQCPTVVVAQVELLCKHRSSCSVSCDCNADRQPPCSCGDASVAGPLAVPAWPCNGVPKTLGLTAVCSDPSALASPPPASTNVKTMLEFMSPPVRGLDNLSPHFSWTLPVASDQNSFRINVTNASSHIVWTSGRVEDPNPQFAVPLESPMPLLSDARYEWTLEVFSTSGSPIVSTPAEFTTGLLHQSDWIAEWIDAGPCPEIPGTWSHGAHWLPDASCQGGLLRKDFEVTQTSKRVSLFVSGCQYYEVYLDGRRVGSDAGITQTWTRFNRFRQYATLDLDPSMLPPGPHALGLHIGQGFCGEPEGTLSMNGTRAAMLQLVLHHDDGSTQEIVTDGHWQLGQSPLVWESAYYGETYLSKLEQPGWATAEFHPTTAWSAARVIVYSPPPFMTSQLQPPIRAVRTVEAVSVQRVLRENYTQYTGAAAFATPARWTFDFGQEFSGHIKLSLPAGVPEGTNFTLSFGEILSHPPLKVVTKGVEGPAIEEYDGSVYLGNLFWANQVDVFQSGAAGQNHTQTYEQRFTYHAFRYVELTADPPLPPELESAVNVHTVVGINVRTAAREQSSLRIANPLLAKLSSNAWWTEASALIGMPHGAGARGERAGWSGDAAAGSESEAFDFDTGAFFTQFLLQIGQTSCKADATIGDCIPGTDPRRDTMLAEADPDTCSGLSSDPTWSTVYVTVAHNVWKYYGAINVIRQHYPQLKQYMSTVETRKNSTGLGAMFCQFGDWNPVVQTPCHITAALSYIHDVRRMVDLALAIGNEEDAAMWSAKDAALTAEFHLPCELQDVTTPDTAHPTSTHGFHQVNRFYTAPTQICKGQHGGFWVPDTQTYSTGTQMSVAAALWLGGIPSSHNPTALLGNLSQEVSNGGGLTVGFVGVQYMFEALVWANRTDAAIACLLRTSFPGYGHELYNTYEPATTLWESWTGDTMTQWLAESSRNHHYQTSIHTFLRKYVAGLHMPRRGRHGGAKVTSAWDVVGVRPEAALLHLMDRALAEEIPSAAVSIESHRGLIQVGWRRHWSRVSGSYHLQLNVTVPPGSTGEIHVPMVNGAGTAIVLGGEETAVVWKGGRSDIEGVSGLKEATEQGPFIRFDTTPGSYSFTAQ